MKACKGCGTYETHAITCPARKCNATRDELLAVVRDFVRVTNCGDLNPAFPIGKGMQAQITETAQRATALLVKE
jgi:hypothetical protein